ncbi:hypothetical protein ACIBO2_28615 [Nonomuraea sp. NPDC050022]|uniref:hypothetical protein n=1 Tax=unclassified Nonomuraea TaxID=2593643 RepID=UPI0033C8E4E1
MDASLMPWPAPLPRDWLRVLAGTSIGGDQVLIAHPESNRLPADLFPGSPGIDVEAAERAAAALLAAIGVSGDSEATDRTPARMLAGWRNCSAVQRGNSLLSPIGKGSTS